MLESDTIKNYLNKNRRIIGLGVRMTISDRTFQDTLCCIAFGALALKAFSDLTYTGAGIGIASSIMGLKAWTDAIGNTFRPINSRLNQPITE